MIGYKSPTHQGWKDAKSGLDRNPYPTRPRYSYAHGEYQVGQRYYREGLNYLGEKI